MKYVTYRFLTFVVAFLIGLFLSPDNLLSLWPDIPSLEKKYEIQHECSIGAAGRDKQGNLIGTKCVCRPIER
jgi:hypothetical protein